MGAKSRRTLGGGGREVGVGVEEQAGRGGDEGGRRQVGRHGKGGGGLTRLYATSSNR
jgi:hypothetical protein